VNDVKMIAVGYDGSRESDAAVRWAFHMARETNAYVTVVHATGLLEHLGTNFSPGVAPPALSAIAKKCGFDQARLRWSVTDGDACSVLFRAVNPPINAELLVVGSRGRGEHSGMLMGSTSLEVVEHATLPVVVVPSDFVPRAVLN